MGSVCREPPGTFALDRSTQEHLLERLSASHREAVASRLHLPCESSARQIAEWFESEDRLRAIFDGISDAARELVGTAAFDTGGVALSVRADVLGEWSFGPEAQAAATELERCGLAFAFVFGGEIAYHIPVDMRARLRRLVAAHCARESEPVTVQQWLPAERRDLHDIVALWVQLAKTPASLTQEGELHARSVSRLTAALPELELPDPEGTIAEWRLGLALAQLRDGGYLRLRMTDKRAWKRDLIPAGDLAGALEAANPFQRFPGRVRSGDFRQDLREEDGAICARALSDALAGRTIGLSGFGQAMLRLQEITRLGWRDTPTAETLALFGLLPGWLRGEVQLGVTRAAPTAARFVHPELEPCDVSHLADRCGARPVEESIEDDSEDDDHSPGLWAGPETRRKWAPQEPPALEKNHVHSLMLGGPGLILLSTLDAPLHSSATGNPVFVAV